MSAIPTVPREASPTIHLTHGAHIVTGVLEADKAIALGLARALVTDHLGLEEGWEAAEGASQDVIVHLIPQISAEDPEVVWGWERSQRMPMLPVQCWPYLNVPLSLEVSRPPPSLPAKHLVIRGEGGVTHLVLPTALSH